MSRKRKSRTRKALRTSKKVVKPKDLKRVVEDDETLALRESIKEMKAERASQRRKVQDKVKLKQVKKRLKKEERRMITDKTNVGGLKRNLGRLKVKSVKGGPTKTQSAVKKRFFRF